MSTVRYEVNMQPAPREAVRLLYISKSRYGGDWHSMMHSHACTELFYCISGIGQFDIEGRLYNVVPDDMVIINPQVEHTELSLNSNPLEYVVLGVEGIEFYFGHTQEGCAMLNCKDTRERLLFLFQNLLQEINDQQDGCETICQDLLDVLLLWLVRANNYKMLPATAKLQSSSKECVAVKRYIDDHYMDNLTLDQLAEVAHINKYYLARAFQREYGTAPISYLQARRIRESKYLLGNTDHSLSQISALLGFSSLSYFSQRFHRCENMSPNEYRKRVRAGLMPALSKSDTLLDS